MDFANDAIEELLVSALLTLIGMQYIKDRIEIKAL